MSLEARIERLEFKNKKLHQYIDKLIDENHRLRKNNKDLSKQITEQFRNKGAL
jgi:regulator of replication initiation timing